MTRYRSRMVDRLRLLPDRHLIHRDPLRIPGLSSVKDRRQAGLSRDIQQDLNDDLLGSPRLAPLALFINGDRRVVNCGTALVRRPAVQLTGRLRRVRSRRMRRAARSRVSRNCAARDNCRSTGSSLGSIYSVRSRPAFSIHALSELSESVFANAVRAPHLSTRGYSRASGSLHPR